MNSNSYRILNIYVIFVTYKKNGMGSVENIVFIVELERLKH